ncbi:MAG TPA: hypothetical protein VEB21_03670 [Terriglobales bacterium]|nr:hypothetical protein [Terriglobales bacterium]
MSNLHRLTITVAALTAAILVVSVRVEAQCLGDCSADGSVTVDEIITGVNIALGTAELSTCTVLDGNTDSAVTVDEILTAINFALTGCIAGGRCGDGTVDFADGETCDDGNAEDGDGCPADCRIESCEPSGTMTELKIAFSVPATSEATALTVFVRYPDGVVRIPGAGNDPQVGARIFDAPTTVSLTPNDLDYALRVVAFSPDLSPITPGTFFTIAFDNCSGSQTPALVDFECIVEDAADINLDPLTDVTCSVGF